MARHPRASVFHERGWLEALNRTYSYQPFALTGTPAGQQLRSGLVLCRVSSWITGTRCVSLPFADHCDPLLNASGDLLGFTKWLRAECDRQAWKYVELRPISCSGEMDSFTRGRAYCLHTLDLRPTLEQIFQSLNKDSTQRRIRRAERQGLSHETGRSERVNAGVLPGFSNDQEAPQTTSSAAGLVPKPHRMHGRQGPNQASSQKWDTHCSASDLTTSIVGRIQVRLLRREVP